MGQAEEVDHSPEDFARTPGNLSFEMKKFMKQKLVARFRQKAISANSYFI